MSIIGQAKSLATALLAYIIAHVSGVKLKTEITFYIKKLHCFALINRAGGLYGRIFTEFVSADRT